MAFVAIGLCAAAAWQGTAPLTTGQRSRPALRMLAYTESTITITEEQVAAFGGPAERPFVDRAPEAGARDAFDRPAEILITDEQVAAFGGSSLRELSYPPFKDTQAALKDAAAQIAEALEINEAARGELMLQSITIRSELGLVNEALAKVAEDIELESKLPRAAQAKASSGAKPTAVATGDGGKAPQQTVVLLGAAAAVVAACWVYYAQ